ncbi:MAG: PAS domain-containing protein [Candidatus Eiseniibacteriota bacterium]|nr:MAG: PAS domain-containing protein [Candidatus Eisenbacteria bacterium]
MQTRVSETQLDWLIADALPFVLVSADADGRVLFLNAKCEEVFKVRRAEAEGKDIAEVLHSEDTRWLTRDGIDSLGEEKRNEVRFVVDDEELLMRAGVFPVLDEDGDLVCRVALLEDLSDLEIDEELQRKMDRLISLGELSACVAHEIRNPLTGIRTTVQFVGSKLGEGDQRKEDLGDVIKELDRIEQIITDLLIFANPQPGRQSETSLNPVIEKVVDNLALQFSSADVKVETKLAENLPAVLADPDLIQQVFLNLSLNAIQAMPKGGTLRIGTSLKRRRSRKSHVVVTFRDTGRGIPEENLDRVFVPFFTTRSMGTGLGLSISLRIVRDHGGTITAENSKEGGAVFTVTLPAG